MKMNSEQEIKKKRTNKLQIIVKLAYPINAQKFTHREIRERFPLVETERQWWFKNPFTLLRSQLPGWSVSNNRFRKSGPAKCITYFDSHLPVRYRGTHSTWPFRAHPISAPGGYLDPVSGTRARDHVHVHAYIFML